MATGAPAPPGPPVRPPAVVRVGPADWRYTDWGGTVYLDPTPPGFDPLAYLTGYVDTVGINATSRWAR